MNKIKLGCITFFVILCFSACSTTTSEPTSSNVVFTNPVFERMVRSQMGILEGNITVAEAEAVSELNLKQKDDVQESEKIRDLSDLKYFINLTKLDIYNNAIEDISILSDLTKLEILEAPKNNISDISALSGLNKLKHAVFWQNQICDLGPVSSLTNLEVLSITDNRVSDISPLSNLTKLHCLELRGNYIIDFRPIAGILPNIKESDGFEVIMPDHIIFFTDPVLEERVRQAMSKPNGDITIADALQVTELDIYNEWQEKIPYEIQIHDISSLKYFQNLFKLAVGNHSISDISVVNYMPNLGILQLDGNPFNDLSPVSGLHNLKILDLGGWQGSDLAPISALTQLEWLKISHSQIDDISPLTELTNLNTLFAEAAVEDFSPISKHEKLRTLYILTGIEDKYIPDLSPLKGIYKNLTDKNFIIE